MSEKMDKHEALLQLLWAIGIAEGNSNGVKFTNAEDRFYEAVKKAEGITIGFGEIKSKIDLLKPTIGYDGIINEALEATSKFDRDWIVKVYGYMWRMALQSVENGNSASAGEKEIIQKAKAYFDITLEEDKVCMSKSRI